MRPLRIELHRSDNHLCVWSCAKPPVGLSLEKQHEVVELFFSGHELEEDALKVLSKISHPN